MTGHESAPSQSQSSGDQSEKIDNLADGSYEERLSELADSDDDPRWDLHRSSAVEIPWLNKRQTMALVTASAERSWLFNQYQSHADSHPWQVEFESWARRALDAMWAQVATGVPIDMAGCDPDVFADRPPMDQTDLMSALFEAFEFAVLRLSAEWASFSIVYSQCSFLETIPVDLLHHRRGWYETFSEPFEHRHLSRLETEVVQMAHPLRLTPDHWLQRDIGLLKDAGNEQSLVGLREISTNDVRVGLELKQKLDEVVLPPTGPITADVWPAEVRSMVGVAIEETMQRSL